MLTGDPPPACGSSCEMQNCSLSVGSDSTKSPVVVALSPENKKALAHLLHFSMTAEANRCHDTLAAAQPAVNGRLVTKAVSVMSGIWRRAMLQQSRLRRRMRSFGGSWRPSARRGSLSRHLALQLLSSSKKQRSKGSTLKKNARTLSR